MDTVRQPATSEAGFRSGKALAFPETDIVTYALDRLQELRPDHVVYADADDPENCIQAGNVKSTVDLLSAGLKAHGVKAGDCVCIHSSNSIWYPLLWLAVIASGGIVTGSNPAYTTTELAHHFRTTNTKFVIAEAKCLGVIKEGLLECGVLPQNIIVQTPLGTNDDIGVDQYGFTSWNVLFKHNVSRRVTFDDEETQTTSVAVYAATSGTTGLPKAAELSHKYLVAQAANLEHVFSKRKETIRQLVCLPVFHAFAAQLAIVLPLRLGITTFFMPRFNLPGYLDHVSRLQITDSAVVPPIISILLSAPKTRLKSLRYVICAGAPMTTTVQTQLYSKLEPDATIAQCWGTTELGWITLFEPGECDYSGSVGRLLPNTTLKIIDEHGKPVTTDNTPGEAHIKSCSMFKRYRHASEANEEAFDEDGYCRTGDRVFTQGGKIFVNGRIKDTMKVNGWQVSPEEIEQVIRKIDGIADCTVVGHNIINKQTSLQETKPRAFVVLKPGSALVESDIQKEVSKNLVSYKRLSGGVVFVDTIPRSNTGKILRRKLVGDQIRTPTSDGLKRIADEGDVTDGQVEHATERTGHEELIQNGAINAWTRYGLAMVLVPLCCALGLPGLLLLCLVTRLIIGNEIQYK